MVKHLARILRDGAQDLTEAQTAARDVIILACEAHRNTHCFVCGGFGHRWKTCRSMKNIKSKMGNTNAVKNVWNRLLTTLQQRYRGQ